MAKYLIFKPFKGQTKVKVKILKYCQLKMLHTNVIYIVSLFTIFVDDWIIVFIIIIIFIIIIVVIS